MNGVKMNRFGMICIRSLSAFCNRFHESTMYALHVHKEKVGPIPSVDGLLIQQLKYGFFFNP